MTRHYAGKSCEPIIFLFLKNFRGKELGKSLFGFIQEYATSKDCETLEFNSYVENLEVINFI